MRGFSSEQVLMLADDFCSACNTTINDFAALAAIAAVTTASFEGTSPFSSPTQQSEYLRSFVPRVSPLTRLNDAFGIFLSRVLKDLNS
ncbi:hypothetical protein [Corynebacterium ulcerans]|uniref:TetR family regulatory protein n=2 Tax=Corynebacterium ulcerans TaxID=65058 RepID=A0ABD0BEV0_CORUL|nr:hypothetical protein [Corynebacterium ulcerans]AEG80549.1 hypothetical protein CULC809_00007 [Corynebacterium ulcerans 809]AIT87991.1 Hypothetical protein Cul210932_0007 [Corynebacterium ulcerans]AIU29384.1 Hypothetical protein Cul210931_0007 [Corynebacterium ulcerans]AIU90616.1 Hypothetical protein Cul05146_0007 [Corynebacterium ulcerans]AKN75861.1 Hypothetical protein CulFRC58_0007 [Corynebacterium ulcerans FRC58]